MYHKSYANFYQPFFRSVNIDGEHLMEFNYAEVLDTSCVEFPHVHDNHEIYFILEGSIRFEVNDRCFSLMKNDFLLLTPGQVHHSIYDPVASRKYFVLIFDLYKIEADLSSGTTGKSDPITVIDEPFIIGRGAMRSRNILDTMFDNSNALGDNPFLDINLPLCYTSFVLSIMQKLSGTEDIVKSQRESREWNLAIEMTRYLHTNYNRHIAIKDLADHFHMSERNTARIFKQYFGVTLSETLVRYRINYAKIISFIPTIPSKRLPQRLVCQQLLCNVVSRKLKKLASENIAKT